MKKIILLLFLLSSFVITNAQCWKITASGFNHTLAIKTDSTLWAWGYNNFGALGDGTFSDKLSPVQIGVSKNWKSISGGYDHSLAIKNDGTLWAWGNNNYGQLGDSTHTMSNVPIQVGSENNWKFISAGISYSFAIKNDGTLWAWGDNFYYQLGDGTRTTRKTPEQIGTDANWQQISSLGSFAIALKTNGTIWGWGNNNYGQIGIGDSTLPYILAPVQVGTDNDWKTIATGGNFCLALKKDSTMWGWGDNEYGQASGVEPSGYAYVLVPTEIDSNSRWKFIATGSLSSFAIKADGTFWAWGNDDENQLGIGPIIPPFYRIYSITNVSMDTNWEYVSSRDQSSTAIKGDSTLWVWGDNSLGEYGNGNEISTDTPVEIQCSSSLPITLVSFTVQKQHETTLLTWQTATEQNNKEYQIERSSDGITFNKIGVVISNNNISGSRYSYVDAHPLSGNNYYRLKSVDIDGKFSYSNIDEVTFTQSNELIVYPNPAKDVITIENNLKGNNLNIFITDLAGRKISQIIRPNNSVLQLSVANLKTGLYILKITDGISSITQKLVKE